MTEKQVIAQVKRAAKAAGGIRALARQWDVSDTLISDVIRGNRHPGPAVCSRLGLAEVMKVVRTYQPTIPARPS